MKNQKMWYNSIRWFYIINKDKNRKIRNKYLISKNLGWGYRPPQYRRGLKLFPPVRRKAFYDIDHPNIEGD
ncbi:hypothetical protein HMPREF9015_00517 [Leptotrichia wadei F0279]|uniref:Uncharacterized protein n=1 Tax=Leptotrichia wadei (strain F0279) TaxID=888055 RepID=U2RRX6_LEPWF|nr:hypothetical protein HMPREF9015_00517 [Leptotrichia wadei F0279]